MNFPPSKTGISTAIYWRKKSADSPSLLGPSAVGRRQKYTKGGFALIVKTAEKRFLFKESQKYDC